jgi:GMP synthase (glutamine-hydrolysing)
MLDARTSEAQAGVAAGGEPAVAGRGRPANKPVLFVLHQEHSNPGHVGHWFRHNGHALDIRKPRFGEALPTTLAAHCGAVIFGGPMSANDKDAFIAAETAWIGVALREGKPLLGICLGAQMLANHLGGRVGFDRHAAVEVGYYSLHTTPAAGALGPFPAHVYQWHREGCELAAGARLLATSDGPFPNQAFAYGAAVGVQFHPEITHAQIYRWTARSTGRLNMPGARPRQEHIVGHITHGPRVRAWLDRFLAHWLAGRAAPMPAPALASGKS